MTSSVNLPIGETTMKPSAHDDNSGALVLAKTLPPQFTPYSKYYAIKTIWFCEAIHKRCIQLLKINTVEQLGDIFTKSLIQVTFEYFWKKIIEWRVMGHKAQGGFTTYHQCILFHSLHSHKVWYRSWEECQARLIRPLACVGVLWAAIWYHTTLLVHTATVRPYLRFIHLT